ncbi:MAG: type II secretion system protein GspN [Bdellovibrionota bacterium]|nr:type II secretion system protein GspN [Deltaproteobacteria bacterium]
MAQFSIKSFREKYGRFILVGSIVFFIGLILHFPVQRLAPLITTMIEKNTGYQISASEIAITMPPGLDMQDVYVQGPPIMDIPVNHYFESVKLYPSVMSLLTYFTKKSLGISFKVQRQKERWSGTVAYGPKFTDIKVKAKNLDYTITQDLGKLNPMLANQSISINSKFDFSFDFDSPTKELTSNDFTKANGAIWLASKDSNMESGLVGKLDFNDSLIKADLKKGTLTIEDIHLTGEKLSLAIEGGLNLQKSIDASKIDKADINLFIDPSLEQLVGMISMVGSMNQLAFQDNVMKFRISGPINNLPKWRVTSL